MITLIRGIIKKFTSTEGKSQKFDASGRTGESFAEREAFGQYGFASSLPAGAEGILLKSGQNVFLIASDDRRYRIALDEGEVGIYTEFGDNILLKKNNTIEVNASGATGKVVVNAKTVYLGGELLAEGVVTIMCQCTYSGGFHPVGSSTVKAQM